ncbi:uncharacterized protein CCOS01_01720 [Colletotrichum costaricense]|uniref:Uncharacterized protein n=1 Tax=Colletotrichum costaricense TaxID=1209916 RepID=A0AAI9Z6K4_9PEZI|nr:uncharacterized protein CCOS01_01720 [Colletotrichum costaricense]KAI3535505.1 hypothetical protein CSPX01_11321 [Colletotrichum filicis]KAK1536400.1 hypothetical protein CCOS01_01720 [Colletotrichum costaricense]
MPERRPTSSANANISTKTKTSTSTSTSTNTSHRLTAVQTGEAGGGG